MLLCDALDEQCCTLESLLQPPHLAGRRAGVFNQPARRVIDELVRAVAEHCLAVGSDGTAVDVQVWIRCTPSDSTQDSITSAVLIDSSGR